MTIGGQLDVGLAQIKNGLGNTQTTLGSGVHGASRVWFTGTEDLGGNMKANWRLEMQPDMTNGTTSSNGIFNRGAWAGVSGNFGELRMGRQATNTIAPMVVADQHGLYGGFYGGGILFSGQAAPTQPSAASAWFAANPTRGGVGQATGSLAAFATTSALTGANTVVNQDLKAAQASSTGNLNQASPNAWNGDATRFVRAIRYSLPTLAAGLSINASYAFAQTLGVGASAGELNGGDSMGFDATYANGPMVVSGAYQKAKADAAGGASGELTTVGGSYNFGVASVGLGYQEEKASGGTGLQFTKGEATALTVLFPMGATTPYLKYGEKKYSGGSLGSVTTAKITNIGARYALSKRSLIYVDYVTNGATVANTGPSAIGAQKSVASSGLQHSF